MSQKRVTGLASAFEPTKSDAPPPSAVSSLASRFDAPPAKGSEPKVSEKVSGIASRFGATVADATPKSPGGKKKVEKVEEERRPVVEERPDFSAISARFASGRAGVKDEKLEDRPGSFARAASAFRKIEEESRPRGEGVVGMFKKKIEGGGKEARVEREEKKEEKKEERVMAERMERVGSIKSRFEGGGEKVEEKKEEETLTNRFENATKLFGGEEKKEGEGVAPGSKFMDASRVFAGGAN